MAGGRPNADAVAQAGVIAKMKSSRAKSARRPPASFACRMSWSSSRIVRSHKLSESRQARGKIVLVT
ncbi:hypothetical protein [Microbispora sp. NPDC046933]|uniref:hypothetical protein n=1 Tax=Microbispora sp. NPDC046933 TaxID=3155618 RepID=UPI0033FB4265